MGEGRMTLDYLVLPYPAKLRGRKKKHNHEFMLHRSHSCF